MQEEAKQSQIRPEDTLESKEPYSEDTNYNQSLQLTMSKLQYPESVNSERKTTEDIAKNNKYDETIKKKEPEQSEDNEDEDVDDVIIKESSDSEPTETAFTITPKTRLSPRSLTFQDQEDASEDGHSPKRRLWAQKFNTMPKYQSKFPKPAEANSTKETQSLGRATGKQVTGDAPNAGTPNFANSNLWDIWDKHKAYLIRKRAKDPSKTTIIKRVDGPTVIFDDNHLTEEESKRLLNNLNQQDQNRDLISEVDKEWNELKRKSEDDIKELQYLRKQVKQNELVIISLIDEKKQLQELLQKDETFGDNMKQIQLVRVVQENKELNIRIIELEQELKATKEKIYNGQPSKDLLEAISRVHKEENARVILQQYVRDLELELDSLKKELPSHKLRHVLLCQIVLWLILIALLGMILLKRFPSLSYIQ